jgi:hypothetical protein
VAAPPAGSSATVAWPRLSRQASKQASKREGEKAEWMEREEKRREGFLACDHFWFFFFSLCFPLKKIKGKCAQLSVCLSVDMRKGVKKRVCDSENGREKCSRGQKIPILT